MARRASMPQRAVLREHLYLTVPLQYHCSVILPVPPHSTILIVPLRCPGTAGARCKAPPQYHFDSTTMLPRCCRYEMQDLLAIESAWLTELAPHMYRVVPVNPQLRG